jgi:hypothetical protein
MAMQKNKDEKNPNNQSIVEEIVRFIFYGVNFLFYFFINYSSLTHSWPHILVFTFL